MPLNPFTLIFGVIAMTALIIGLVVMALFVGTLVAVGGLVLAAGSGIYYAVRNRLGKPAARESGLAVRQPSHGWTATQDEPPMSRLRERDTVIDVEVVEAEVRRP